MKLRFLGTGTSFGIPVVGCDCSVCTSADPRNRRTRHGLLIQRRGRTLLVDAPPELRLQLVRAGVRHLDTVFLTHPHADHVHGLDDLRIFSLRSRRPVPLFVAREFAAEMRERFSYIWGPDAAPADGTVIPELELTPFRDRESLDANGFPLRPVACPHGPSRSYGFRLDDLAVLVDAKSVPEDAIDLLGGVRVLVINALWVGNAHPSHFNVEEALEMARRLGAGRTYLTHLSHRVEHEELAARLPEGVVPAHDGLEVEV
ncbi:MAG: MBL fold metallo-hydrolase [Gemmatimonadota bacterium]